VQFASVASVAVAVVLVFGQAARAQTTPPPSNVPAPSQVAPPAIPTAPRTPPSIAAPAVPQPSAVPEAAKKLSFILTGLDIEGEFEDLVEIRRKLAAPLIGKKITVAQLFEFASNLQQAYVRAGYTLARVIVPPQELAGRARAKIKVIDGFIERLDVSGLPEPIRSRVADVVGPLIRQHRLTQKQLERKLLIASETPGLQLQSTLAPGKEVGGAILILAGRYRPVSASLYFDNSLPKTFGTWQTVSTGTLNSLFGAGEQISVSAAGYPTSDFFTARPTRRFLTGSLAVPLGYDGLKLEMTATDAKTTPHVIPAAASQGLFDQGRLRIAYDALKSRDFELTLRGGLDATKERIDTLALGPALPLSLDEVRVLRGSIDGISRLRENGTTIAFGATLSRGVDILGARRAADANPLLPLSRQGADAVFTKLDGRVEVIQSLVSDFVASLAIFGQTSFNRPMLTSEQFDIVGSKMLSSFTAGALSGDTAWAARGELGRPIALTGSPFSGILTPYGFAAVGSRILHQPTVLELGTVHAWD